MDDRVITPEMVLIPNAVQLGVMLVVHTDVGGSSGHISLHTRTSGGGQLCCHAPK